jgi:hypothetical protein
MADVAPKQKTTPRKRVAQLVRLLGSPVPDEQRMAWRKLTSAMQDAKVTFTDVGVWIEEGAGDLYTADQMQDYFQAGRAEGIEEGKKLAQALASRSAGKVNGHGFTLPDARTMAEYCHQCFGQLKNDWQRQFVSNIFSVTRGTHSLSKARLANLARIYIEFGGRT